MNMSSNRPYLLRAIYDWIVDNGLTPHLLVNAEGKDLQIPRQYVQDGKIVLNIAPSAVHNLDLGNEWIGFSARFSGMAQTVFVPITAVLAIYARENGQGLVFQPDILPPDGDDQPPGPPEPTPERPVVKKPMLKRVK